MFGLCRGDAKLLHGTTTAEWSPWTDESMKDNQLYVDHLMIGLEDILDIGSEDFEDDETQTTTTTASAIVG